MHKDTDIERTIKRYQGIQIFICQSIGRPFLYMGVSGTDIRDASMHICQKQYRVLEKKFQDNIERDVEVKSELGKVGIKEVIIWECTIKEMKENERRKVCCLRKIKRFMNEGKIYLEI